MAGIIEHWSHSLATIVAQLTTAIIDFVYPPACLLCRGAVDMGGSVFCETCQAGLKHALNEECPRCGAPVGLYVDLKKGCGQCRTESFAFDRVIRLGVYDGGMRLACLRAKADSGSSVARGLADALVNAKQALFVEHNFDLVIPIPEHWTRRFLHRHYAAETISRQVSRRLRLGYDRTNLMKSRRTPKQATSTKALRRQQQQGSFQVRRPKHLKGKSILLIDDILTTGSTASAAARTLKQAGAKRVVVVVIAVSPLRK